VKVTLYLQDLKYRAPFHKVWMETFGDDAPARIAIGVANADVSPTRENHCHFALDVIAVDPSVAQ
jgi:2-iminobutanoate/2-iminopropanoate deaminase